MVDKTIHDIELDKVLSEISSYSLLESGGEITSSSFTSDRELLKKRYDRVDSYLNLLEGAEPLDTFPSLTMLLEELNKSHKDADGKDIYAVGIYLSSFFKVKSFLHQEDEIYDEDRELSKEILSSLDSNGDVLLSHPRLLPLIKRGEEIRAERARFSAQYISENRQRVQNEMPVYRNERVTIALRADMGRKDCYVSSLSQSGLTIFAEPFTLVELNNNVVLQDEKIRAEKLKIKHELSERVRYIAPVLRKMIAFVEDFNFHYLLALWAKRCGAKHIKEGDRISIINAVHPLLNKAVPISLTTGEDIRIIVISGANAGGKTVSMKTIALMAALNQIATFVPMSEHSELPIFDDIFSDIGDGQSIFLSASTFSSHLYNISSIIKQSTKRSLVLFDELGSGTDPEEGSALSLSILKYMVDHSFLTIATSHYSAVKNLAYSDERMLNASMEFDTASSRPTYKILSGIPGESHAIAVAVKSGLPKEIVEGAKSMLSDGTIDSANIITGLLSKTRTLDRKISEAERYRREAETKKKEAEELARENDKLRFELKKKGLSELSSYMNETRKRLERLVMDIQNGELTKEKTREMKAFIADTTKKEEQLRSEVKSEGLKYEEVSDDHFEKGDRVESRSTKARGEIISISGKDKAIVLFDNGLRMSIKLSLLAHAPSENIKSEYSHFKSSKRASYTLDIRGKKVSEVEEILKDQMEAAILSQMKEFAIIHGYGDGILSLFVSKYLRTYKEVASLRFAQDNDGGMGKTYVTLR